MAFTGVFCDKLHSLEREIMQCKLCAGEHDKVIVVYGIAHKMSLLFNSAEHGATGVCLSTNLSCWLQHILQH